MPILSTFGAGSFAGVHPLASGGEGGGPPVIGRYFYHTTDYLWSTLANWFGNSGHTTNANEYPDDNTSVVILSNCTADYDSPEVVEPADISVAASCTLTLTSTAAVSVSCPITNVGVGNTGTLVIGANVTYTGA